MQNAISLIVAVLCLWPVTSFAACFDAPADIEATSLSPAEFIKPLQACDYRVTLEALVAGASGDMEDSCSFFGLAKANADECAEAQLGPDFEREHYREIDKLFYLIYQQVRDDLSTCAFVDHVSVPFYGNPLYLTRDMIRQQCPHISPDEIGPQVSTLHSHDID